MPAKRASKPITITLPAAMAKKVKARVASGDYESASEVIREGLRALDAQEAALEEWLRTEGVKRLQAYKANPQDTSSAKDMRARLDAHMKKPVARRK
jgi:putative addiction module CopG family antidote